MAIASFAGCVNVLMTLPIWTIVTKMQADVRRRENDRDDGEEAASVERDVDAETAAAKRRVKEGRKTEIKTGAGRRNVRSSTSRARWYGMVACADYGKG